MKNILFIVIVGVCFGRLASAQTSNPSLLVNAGPYPVQLGCDIPSSSYATDIYVDPISGADISGNGTQSKPFKTFSFAASKLIGGERVHLLPGSYGAISMISTRLSKLVGNKNWIWLDFQQGAKTGKIDIRGMSHILITGAESSTMAKNTYIIDVGYGSNNVVIADNHVYSSTTNNLTATQWMSLSSGIDVSDTKCASVLRNTLQNVRMAFGIGYSGSAYPANSCKILVQDNDVKNLSGDGMRMNCSDLIIRRNRIVDGYVSGADGDGNHDDFIQGFALNGTIYENILVEENYFQDRTSQTRPYISDYQGISDFDGVFRNVTVRKNIVIAGAYHGISLGSVDTALIEYNTVISSSNKGLWIRVGANKSGVPAINNVVRNNLATRFTNTQAMAQNINNFAVSNPQQNFISFDFVNDQFDLHLKPSSPLYNKGAGAL